MSTHPCFHRAAAPRTAGRRRAALAVASICLAGACAAATPAPGIGDRVPTFAGATGWLNSPPLSATDLHGKVVLVEFWTYGCINCQHAIPHVRDFAQRYKNLVVVGVHSPETDAERRPANVQQAVRDLHLPYPIAIDNDYAVWNAFGNRYWPALYLVDAEGKIRYRHLGEGAYADEEAEIRQLLGEAHADVPSASPETASR